MNLVMRCSAKCILFVLESLCEVSDLVVSLHEGASAQRPVAVVSLTGAVCNVAICMRRIWLHSVKLPKMNDAPAALLTFFHLQDSKRINRTKYIYFNAWTDFQGQGRATPRMSFPARSQTCGT